MDEIAGALVRLRTGSFTATSGVAWLIARFARPTMNHKSPSASAAPKTGNKRALIRLLRTGSDGGAKIAARVARALPRKRLALQLHWLENE